MANLSEEEKNCTFLTLKEVGRIRRAELISRIKSCQFKSGYPVPMSDYQFGPLIDRLICQDYIIERDSWISLTEQGRDYINRNEQNFIHRHSRKTFV